MWSVYEIIHIWTTVADESEEWSSQLMFQFKQLERIRASKGFEPVTSAIPVRCSTNWAELSQLNKLASLNLVPRAFSSTIFKMADRREKTLAKAWSRGTKSPKILEIFITWHFEKGQNKMAAKHRVFRRYLQEWLRAVKCKTADPSLSIEWNPTLLSLNRQN